VSTVQRFSAAHGANFHCEPMARQHMFDWLDEKLGRRSPTLTELVHFHDCDRTAKRVLKDTSRRA
jgi:hypothetical protein